MTPLCERAGAYADEQLDEEEASRFREHLETCERCQRALAGSAALAARPPAGHSARPMILAALAASLLLAGTAALAFHWRGSTAGVLADSGPTRPLEARMTHPGLAAHRPYGPRSVTVIPARAPSAARVAHPPGPLSARAARSAAPATSASPEELAASARMERLKSGGDRQALAEAYIERSELGAAEAELARLPPGADVDSDKALAAMMRGQSEVALSLFEAALKARPDHPQALWNRALMLRDLGLLSSAAAGFARVASLGEPGWAGEAKQRASLLEAQLDEREALYAAALGTAIGEGELKPPIGAPTGLLRHALYEGMRAAGDRDRALRLLPLANGLHEGATALEDEVKRIAALDFLARGPQAKAYRGLLVARALPDRAQQDALHEAFRSARQLDLVAGLAALTGRETEWLDELRIGFRTDDPWQHALTEAAAARAERAEGKPGADVSSEQRLRAALATCEAARLDYPCALLELELAAAEAARGKVDAARARAASSLRRGLRPRLVPLEARLLLALADVTRAIGDKRLAEAYTAEAHAREGRPRNR
jgi:cellulose synthase operon protein C